MNSGSGIKIKALHGEETFQSTAGKGGNPIKRTRKSGWNNINSSFKSPVQVSSMLSIKKCVKEEITELQNTLLQLESNITQLENEGVCVDELEHHIDLLHEYNDVKDTAQTLLGRLAGLRGVTTRDLYTRFGMEPDD